MIILGTPQVSLNLGIPDWLILIILIIAYLIYFGLKKVYQLYQNKKSLEEEVAALRAELETYVMADNELKSESETDKSSDTSKR